MKKTIAILVVIGAVCGNSIASASVALLEKDDWKILLNGFVEIDTIHDTTRSFGEYFGNGAVSRPGSLKGDNGRTQFSGRNSRLGLTVLAPAQSDWKSKAVLEFDLFGYEPTIGTSDPNMSEAGYYQNPALRVRHSYLAAEKETWQMTAGQTWSLFGWQPFYFPAVVSVAPEAGELFQRTLQFAVLNSANFGTSSKLQTAVSIERPSQRDAQVPNLNWGLRYSFESLRSGFTSTYGENKTEPFSVGASGTFKQFTTPLSVAQADGQRHHNSAAVAVDILLPLLPANGNETGNSLSFSGEFTSGTGYADALPGWTGGLTGFASNTSAGNLGDKTNLDAGHAGFDANGEFSFINLQTWNASLQYHFPGESKTFTNFGYGQIFSDNVGNLTAGGTAATAIYDKSTIYFLNVIRDVTKQIRLGIEYDLFSTHYFSDQSSATNERFQFTALFRF